MGKKKRRVLVALLSLCVVIAMFPATGMAAETCPDGEHVWSDDQWHNYVDENGYSENHCKECVNCGYVLEEPHQMEGTTCTVCGYIQPCEKHTWEDWETGYGVNSASGHFRICSVCGFLEEQEHQIKDGECTVCGWIVPCENHTWSENYYWVGTYAHAIQCEVCGEVKETEPHTDGESCTLCQGPWKKPCKEHTYGYYNATETTHEKICDVCDRGYEEEHNWNVDKATPLTDKYCTLCGYVAETATIEPGTEAVMDYVVEEAISKSGNSKEVVLNLSGGEQAVTAVVLSSDSIEALAVSGKALTVKTGSASVTFDKKALNAIADSADGGEIRLEVTAVSQKALNSHQKNAIKGKKLAMVISAELLCNGTSIGDFKGGKATVRIPFTPEKGTKAKDYKVLYVDDEGNTKEIHADYKDGCLVVVLDHFSKYVVVKDTVTDSGVPKTGDGSDLLAWCMFMIISATAAAAAGLFGRKNLQ